MKRNSKRNFPKCQAETRILELWWICSELARFIAVTGKEGFRHVCQIAERYVNGVLESTRQEKTQWADLECAGCFFESEGWGWAGDDAKDGLPVEDPSHGLYYGTQERMGRLVIPDVQAAWAILKAHLSAERYRACLSVNQAELKTALKLKGLKSAEVTELIERCGTRLPPTTVFLGSWDRQARADPAPREDVRGRGGGGAAGSTWEGCFLF